MKWTGPFELPLFLISVPRARRSPKYPEVPPPYLLIMPFSACVNIMFDISSARYEPKQLIGSPRPRPKFAHTGVENEIHPFDTYSTSLVAYPGRLRSFSAYSAICATRSSGVCPARVYPRDMNSRELSLSQYHGCVRSIINLEGRY